MTSPVVSGGVKERSVNKICEASVFNLWCEGFAQQTAKSQNEKPALAARAARRGLKRPRLGRVGPVYVDGGVVRLLVPIQSARGVYTLGTSLQRFRTHQNALSISEHAMFKLKFKSSVDSSPNY